MLDKIHVVTTGAFGNSDLCGFFLTIVDLKFTVEIVQGADRERTREKAYALEIFGSGPRSTSFDRNGTSMFNCSCI